MFAWTLQARSAAPFVIAKISPKQIPQSAWSYGLSFVSSPLSFLTFALGGVVPPYQRLSVRIHQSLLTKSCNAPNNQHSRPMQCRSLFTKRNSIPQSSIVQYGILRPYDEPRRQHSMQDQSPSTRCTPDHRDWH